MTKIKLLSKERRGYFADDGTTIIEGWPYLINKNKPGSWFLKKY